jgi:hypothetical protein
VVVSSARAEVEDTDGRRSAYGAGNWENSMMSGERLALSIPATAEDAAVRQKAASFIGAVATGAWNVEASIADTEEALQTQPIESLQDAIRLAAEGNAEAYKMVEINAITDFVERILKSGNINKITMMADAAGAIQQNGQTLESVQANSLRYAANGRQMRARVEAETRNAFRLSHYYNQGMLSEYNLVTFSRFPDDMPDTDIRKAGFFMDTKSCSIQVTSAEGSLLTTELGFVAGVGQRGGARHDGEAISKVVGQFGLDVSGMSATELIDSPLLIHKSLMPDGVLDLIRQYDAAAGGTFFGENKPAQDYYAYRDMCAEREASFKPTIDKIVAELIAEAPTITSRVMATERLNKISGKHAIHLAAEDRNINPDVFGAPSAARIEMARWHLEKGNRDQADREIIEAVKTDRSSSCPSGGTDTNGNPESDTGADEDGDCEFTSLECPECHKKNVKTTVKIIIEKGMRKKHISGDCGCSKTVSAV